MAGNEKMSYQQAIAEANRINGKGAKRENKYGAVKSDGPEIVRYDSKAERDRAVELKALERAGEIIDLERQRKFPITMNDVMICTYIADFSYRPVTRDGSLVIPGPWVVEDVKGLVTQVYALKKKLMLAFYGIEITEITKEKKYGCLHD